jgi:superfamily I DNA/RNA helicase
MAKYSDISILYRTNSQAVILKQYLNSRNIPVNTVGGQGFFDYAEVKDLLALCNWMVNIDDSYSLGRFCSNLKIGVGAGTVNTVYSCLPEHLSIDDLKKYVSTSKRKREKSLAPVLDATQEVIDGNMNAYECLSLFCRKFKILEKLALQDKKDYKSDRSREDNVKTLLTLASRCQSNLTTFVDSCQIGTEDEEDLQNAVTLSTIHKAKG